MSFPRPPAPGALLATVAIVAALVSASAAHAQSTSFEIAGNETLSTREIERTLQPLRENIGANKLEDVDAEDAAHDVERLYAANGFPGATARGRIAGERLIRIEITEGSRTFLGQLTIRGAAAVTEEDLRACFEWQLAGIIGFRRQVFTPTSLSAGRDTIAALYELRGFLDARIETTTQSRPGEKTGKETGKETGEETDEIVDIAVEIIEGTRYEYREPPDIRGAERYAVSDLIRTLDLELPAAANPRLALIWQGRLVDFYKSRGHYFVNIDTRRRKDEQAGTVGVVLTIVEGPLTNVRAVWVRGNDRTRTSVILDRLHLRSGERYSEIRLRETHRSLLRSGLFSNVRITALPTEDTRGNEEEREVVLRIVLTERPTWELKYLIGYGSYELLRTGGSVENRNIFGLGHSLRAEGMISFKGERTSLTYRNPSFFHERLTHTVEGNYERREHPSFTRSEYGGSTGLRYFLTDNASFEVRHRLRQSDVDEVSSAIPSRFIQDVLISSASISALLDTRENLLDPSSGSTNKLTVEYSEEQLGSDLDYVRVTAATTWIWPLFRNLRLVTSAHAGVIDRFGRTDVIPLQERFFLGGENSIRSFLEDEAGPKRRGEPIGGETFVRFNAELRIPIWGDLRGALFYDLGSVSEELDDFASDEYSSAIGAGLRYHTPIGPIRLDAAINPNRRGREDLWALHFALGYPF